MIQTQDEANARARELAAKYNLVETFKSSNPQEIAYLLWQTAKDPFDESDYEAVLEIVELSQYLDPNYFYSYIVGVADFYLDNYVEAVAFFEYGLELIVQKAPLYESLDKEINLELILANLYRMLIQSNLELRRVDESVAVWDATSTLFASESNPDFFIMVAQALAAVGRTKDAVVLLERATVLAEKLKEIDLREDSLQDIAKLLQLIEENPVEEVEEPVFPELSS
ncbi:MAG: hypothetical protein LBG64_01875 [Pseudomonadales bacterium]|jgi:tetratricopeptide (TPR) repeat protein|nr:hypothetical protein [Pseudomonadales bacterium]